MICLLMGDVDFTALTSMVGKLFSFYLIPYKSGQSDVWGYVILSCPEPIFQTRICCTYIIHYTWSLDMPRPCPKKSI